MNPVLLQAIQDVIREHFADSDIEAVRVYGPTVYADDEVYRIEVIFNGKGPLDPHKTASIVRLIRQKLREQKDDTFPLFTFLSKADAEGMKPAAA